MVEMFPSIIGVLLKDRWKVTSANITRGSDLKKYDSIPHHLTNVEFILW